KAVMFNRAFAKNQLKIGDVVTLTGKWDAHRLQITVSNYQKGSMENSTEIQPIYSVRGEVTSFRLKKAIQQAIQDYSHFVEEILPEDMLLSYKIPIRKDALKTMHFPENRILLKHARRRFTYEE